MKVYKFHQFIRIEKGPINSAVIDLLKGDIFQVPNDYIEKFENRQYEEIKDFIETLVSGKMVLNVDEKCWIPVLNLNTEKDKNEEGKQIKKITLEIEDGVDLDIIKEKLDSISMQIAKIWYYGKKNHDQDFRGIPIIRKEKDFEACQTVTCVKDDFLNASEIEYRLNMVYNSCWIGKIAITSDENFRPCIYSQIVLGNLREDSIEAIFREAKKYWMINKDKVEICRDCELKYLCFDCREISFRLTNDLYGCNPNCNYDPYQGTWK